MDSQFQLISKFSNAAVTFLTNYFYSDAQQQQRLPTAAIFDGTSPPPHCAICITDFRGGDRYRKLPDCRHCFHAHCIDAWFRSHSTCPLCRLRVPQIIISLNENQCQWSSLFNNVVLLIQDFFERMCNPINDELSSMLCANLR